MAQLSSEGLIYLELDDEVFVLKNCYVAFANGKRAKQRSFLERIINEITYRWTKGVTHAELAFEFIDRKSRVFIVACNLYLGEQLKFEFKTKQYSNVDLWELHRLELDDAQKVRLFRLCQTHVQRNIYFNTALYWNFCVPPRLAFNGQLQSKAWCSEHVAHCLKEIGMLQFADAQPHLIDPGRLFELVRTRNSKFGPLDCLNVDEAL